MSIYRLLRVEIGLSAQRTETLLARGMLINTLLSLRLPDLVETDEDASTLLRCISSRKDRPYRKCCIN